MAEITKLVGGFGILLLLVTGIFSFYSGGVEKYTPTDYDNSSLTTIQESFNEINTNANATVTALTSLSTEKGIADIFGNIFSGGLNAVKTIFSSTNAISDTIDVALSNIPILGSYAQTIKKVLLFLLVVFVLAVLIKLIFKVVA